MNWLRNSPLALTIWAAVIALAFAAVITSLVLAATGVDPFFAFSQMGSFGAEPDSVANMLDRGTTYYLSALAVAIGFRMNLFNIGVDGQYQLSALMAAAFGGAVILPPGLAQIAIIIVGMLTGAAWAAIPAILKATRGVSEVIATIMLNSIATGVIAFFLTPGRFGYRVEGSNNIGTKPIPASGQVPGIPFPGSETKVFGLIILAVLVGVAYALVLRRTRYGFDLRATGLSQSAALASGVHPKRMVVGAMVASGAVAGLVGMPQLLGESHQYSLDFPAGIGFTGIAIALLGRNSAVGMAFAALLWAFLDQSAQILDLNEIPKEVVAITQATVVLSVVVVYEVVHRLGLKYQQQAVGAVLGEEAVR